MSDEKKCSCAVHYPELIAEKVKYEKLKHQFNYHYKQLQDSSAQEKILLKEIYELKREVAGLKENLSEIEFHNEQYRNLFEVDKKEKERLGLAIIDLRKKNEEQSEFYCRRNLVLVEENKKLNREIERPKEEAKKEPELKVGDKVTVLDSCYFDENTVGKIVEVGGKLYLVEMPDGVSGFYRAESLKKAEEKSLSPAPLKIGDIVSVEYRITREIQGGWCIEVSSSDRFNIRELEEVRFHEKRMLGKIVEVSKDCSGVVVDFQYKDKAALLGRVGIRNVLRFYEPEAPPLKIGDKVKVEFYGEVFDVDDDMRIDTEQNVRVSFENNVKGQLYESAWLWVGNVKKIEG